MTRNSFFILVILTSLTLSQSAVCQDFPDYNVYTNLYTLHNSSVPAKGDPEWDLTQAQKDWQKFWYKLVYNDLTYLGEATYGYNCHFYAWFETENYPNQEYWVDDPSQNWIDYTYRETSSETANGKVTYVDLWNNPIHSANSTTTTGRYRSKWGASCLFEHDWDECPYIKSEYSFDKRRYYERLKISGLPTICTSNSTYSFTNLPSGATGSWSVTPSSSVSPSSGSGTSATFSGYCSGMGNATLTFSITAGGYSFTESKDFNVCGPDATELELEVYFTDGTPAPKSGSVFMQCPNTHYHIYLVNNSGCGTSNYNWTIPSGWTKNYQSSNMISVYTNTSPGGQVQVKGSTCCSSCGSNVSLLTGYLGQYYNCGGGYYMAAPNPGSDFVEIKETSVTSNLKSEASDRNISVTVLNTLGSVVHSANIHSLPYRIETSVLPIGKYIVKIIDGEIVENIQILIDH